jgi:uncharacterized protein involved in exopolysaccharide biosynthesis
MMTEWKEGEVALLEGRELHLIDYWIIIRRRQWVILLVFITLASTITMGIYLQPDPQPLYEAVATLIIDSQKPALVTVEGGKSAYENYFGESYDLNTQLGILNSNIMAERVLTTLKLADPEKDPAGYEAALAEYRKKVVISQVPGTLMVKILARDSNPDQAEKLANTLADVYIDHNLQTKLTAARRAVSWLSEQIVDLKAKVKEAQEALQKFQKQNEIFSLEGNQKVQSEKLAELNTMYVQVKEKRVEAETLLNELKKFQDQQLTSAAAVANTSLNIPSLMALNTELVNTEIELTNLRQTYKEKHPKLQQAELKLQTLKDKMKSEVESLFKAKEAEVTVLKARESALLDSINQYKQETINDNKKAVEYAALQREVTANEELYNILLRQLKETSITGGLEKNNIRILERAKAHDITPTQNRMRNILIGSVIALVSGLVIAFLMEYFDRSIKTPEDVEYYLGLPVLGIVPKVIPEKKPLSLKGKEPSVLIEKGID